MIPPGRRDRHPPVRRSACRSSAPPRTEPSGHASTSGRRGRRTRIVEVGAKDETDREAIAECWLTTTPDAAGAPGRRHEEGLTPLETAKIAGVIGVKETPRLLPHCHPIRVTGADMRDRTRRATRAVPRASRRCARIDRTGVEMEALTAAAVAALSACTTPRRRSTAAARIEGLRLLAKSGGKSGDYRAAD